MATIYKRNNQQVLYKEIDLHAVLPWLIVALVIAGLVTLINSFLSVVWLQILCIFSLVAGRHYDRSKIV